MSIVCPVCPICCDLLAPSNDVFNTPCGHVFHNTCLIEWLRRRKICPQCRGKTTRNEIRKLYLSFPNNDSVVKDAMTLQNRKKIEPEKLNQPIETADRILELEALEAAVKNLGKTRPFVERELPRLKRIIDVKWKPSNRLKRARRELREMLMEMGEI